MSTAMTSDLVAKKITELKVARRKWKMARPVERLMLMNRIDRLLEDLHKMITPVD